MLPRTPPAPWPDSEGVFAGEWVSSYPAIPGQFNTGDDIRGTLAEWSLDARGWLAAFLAEASRRQGISTPLILTATRTKEPVNRVGRRR